MAKVAAAEVREDVRRRKQHRFMAVRLDNLKKAAELTDSVLVMFSTGADSVVTLDLCVKYFKRVEALHLYWVKDLSFHERILKHYEKRYNIKIERRLHPDSVVWLKKNVDSSLKPYKFKNVIQEVKAKLAIEWVTYGYRKSESLQRLSMISSCKGINEKAKILYPIGYWTKAAIKKYIKKNKLPIPINYQYGFRDIGAFKGLPLLWIYNNFPADYEKIKKQFPFIDNEIFKIQNEI